MCKILRKKSAGLLTQNNSKENEIICTLHFDSFVRVMKNATPVNLSHCKNIDRPTDRPNDQSIE